MIYTKIIESQDILWDGIVPTTQRASLRRRTKATGSELNAVGRWGSTNSTVINYDVRPFYLDPLLALPGTDLDPATSYDLVDLLE